MTEDVFVPLAQTQAAAAGMADLPLVVVPRASGGEDRAQLRLVTEGIFDRLIAALVRTDTPSRKATDR